MKKPSSKSAKSPPNRAALFLCASLLTSCGLPPHQSNSLDPSTSSFRTSDSKHLSLRHWNHQQKPDTIILALHGIAGAAQDFNSLGQQLPSRTALYALNIRGLGYDPDVPNRGDLTDPQLWFRDLAEFHQIMTERFPHARTVWLGESMGAIIAVHTAAKTSAKPDHLILSSPVTSISSIPPFQRESLQLLARITPRFRLDLSSLSNGSFQATTSSNHFEQTNKNPWFIEKYTLRFMNQLGLLAEAMPNQASKIHTPTLILFAGQDPLVTQANILTFAQQFPSTPTIHKFEQSHHLLFYDQQKQEVITTISHWLQKK
ncbi:MAG: alpha/beta fold hydrolase [Verrucomicrobiota bacterium]